MIVELEAIHDLVLCHLACVEPHSVKLLDLQGAEDGLG
jgi:hypothetical protein